MTQDEIPAEIRGWIGKERYVEEGEFDVEMSYVATTCASVGSWESGRLLILRAATICASESIARTSPPVIVSSVLPSATS